MSIGAAVCLALAAPARAAGSDGETAAALVAVEAGLAPSGEPAAPVAIAAEPAVEEPDVEAAPAGTPFALAPPLALLDPCALAAPCAAAVTDGEAPAERPPDLTALVASPVHGVESSGFGWRDDPMRHRPRYHRGADFRAPRGTPVYAAADGVVAYAGRNHGYGRLVIVDHGDGLATRYAHLSCIGVRRGEHVDADEPIGQVGSTGRATGPHLHFEVRIAGRPVDPGVALRVAALEREGSPDLAAAALALAPEVQARSVSLIDPPRRRAKSARTSRSSHDEETRTRRAHRRRARVS
jgi:murein DD-endopeptidase MepM/ murein hydrolase activator NlpD